MTELFSRFFLAGFVLALAAAAVMTTGSGGFGGSLGSLFGYHTKVKPVAHDVAVLAVPDVPIERLAAPTSGSPMTSARPGRAKLRARRAPAHAAPRTRPPASAPTGAHPAPAPVIPPVQPPPPKPPAPQGNVERTAQSLQQAIQPVAPPAAPVVEQVAQTVSQGCGMIGACP
jgi:hypothetical protein